jgi:prepilin-type N-terminal cleavage/methylation domain-containing protein/prepilin-type processing-associated H-X9-DG protein
MSMTTENGSLKIHAPLPVKTGEKRGPCRAFTLLEMLVVLSLVAVLIGLAIPEFQRFIDRARSTACSSNLRSIGVTVRNYINEHEGTFPVIETNPENPIYPEGVEARGLFETLEPYGLTQANLRCPGDIAGPNYFADRGTSYEWRPVIDGEIALNPVFYTRRGERRVNPARVRLVIDISPVHNGRMNQLRGDGSVRAFQ